VFEILEKLRNSGVMAAVIRRDGIVQGSNFNLPDGVESMSSFGFNISDALMREVKDEAAELIISAGPKSILMRSLDEENFLLAVIASKEQYEAYKSALGPGKE
jgi:predicted regulator of Ras-like GTPase activity (Roadblock/LC7/MglB family)